MARRVRPDISRWLGGLLASALAAVALVLSAAVFAFLFVPPDASFEPADWRGTAALGVFLVTAVVVGGPGRLPERVEVGAYYVVSEALANSAKHAAASRVEALGGRLYLDSPPGGGTMLRAVSRWPPRVAARQAPRPRCRTGVRYPG